MKNSNIFKNETVDVSKEDFSMALSAARELQEECDEKCVVTAWLKPLYDELYSNTNIYANSYIRQMRQDGYKIDFVTSLNSDYHYTNKIGENKSKIAHARPFGISHIALSGLTDNKSEVVEAWKSCITDKENQVLLLYIPLAAGALFDAATSYVTVFDVITLD